MSDIIFLVLNFDFIWWRLDVHFPFIYLEVQLIASDFLKVFYYFLLFTYFLYIYLYIVLMFIICSTTDTNVVIEVSIVIIVFLIVIIVNKTWAVDIYHKSRVYFPLLDPFFKL